MYEFSLYEFLSLKNVWHIKLDLSDLHVCVALTCLFLKHFLLLVCVVDLGELWGETSGGGRASFRGEGARGKLQTSLCHWNHRHPALLRPGCRDRYLEMVVWGSAHTTHLVFQVYNFRVGLKRQLAKPDKQTPVNIKFDRVTNEN